MSYSRGCRNHVMIRGRRGIKASPLSQGRCESHRQKGVYADSDANCGLFRAKQLGSYRPNRLMPDTLGFLELSPPFCTGSRGSSHHARRFPGTDRFHKRAESHSTNEEGRYGEESSDSSHHHTQNLAAALAEEHDLSKKAAEAILTDMAPGSPNT